MTEAAREYEVPPFSAAEMIFRVGEELRDMQAHRDPARQRPGLTVEPRTFVAGNEGASRDLVTPSEQIRGIIDSPTASARHYLVCQVVSWRGELVVTVYLGISVQGRTLYLESTSTVRLEFSR